MNHRAIFQCGLEITGTEHGEWQGILHTDDGDKPFRSALELLRLLRSAVGPPEKVAPDI